MKGISVSEGIGIGKAYILKKKSLVIEEKIIPEEVRKDEVEAFKKYLEIFKSGIEDRKKKSIGSSLEILEAHIELLNDEELIEPILNEIILGKSIPWAIDVGFNSSIELFSLVEDVYIKERAKDLVDLKESFLKLVLGENEDLVIKEKAIICTEELLPSQFIDIINKGHIEGVLVEKGGVNSHIGIIARSEKIPMITNISLKNIIEGESLIIDGEEGVYIINPSSYELTIFEEKRRINIEKEERINTFINRKSLTKDGKEISIFSNIEKDASSAFIYGADGIGLMRSEFLFLDRTDLPGEEEQYKVYREVLNTMGEKPVIIRTLDVGGDKIASSFNMKKEDNPFLGVRGIRYSLKDESIFRTQIRALLKAGEVGDLHIMLPMVTSIEEVLKAKELIKEEKNALKDGGLSNPKIGIMIEVPGAALIADKLGDICDFFSIGTNDLVQYTLAADRGNGEVADVYDVFHPGVIKLIKLTIDGAKKNIIPCGICGATAENKLLVPLFLALGIDELSVSPKMVPTIREVISRIDLEKDKEKILEVLKFREGYKVKEYLINYIKNLSL